MVDGNTKTSWCGKIGDDGTISPSFQLNSILTSGKLKYFHALKGEYVRVTIEILAPTIYGGEKDISIIDFWETSAKTKIEKDGEL